MTGSHGSSFRSGPGQLRQLHRVGEVERAVDRVDLELRDAQSLLQPLEHRLRHRARDLEPDDVAEAAAAELELDRFQQVVGLVGDLEIGVAGNAEERALEDLHVGEERRQVV